MMKKMIMVLVLLGVVASAFADVNVTVKGTKNIPTVEEAIRDINLNVLEEGYYIKALLHYGEEEVATWAWRFTTAPLSNTIVVARDEDDGDFQALVRVKDKMLPNKPRWIFVSFVKAY